MLHASLALLPLLLPDKDTSDSWGGCEVWYDRTDADEDGDCNNSCEVDDEVCLATSGGLVIAWIRLPKKGVFWCKRAKQRKLMTYWAIVVWLLVPLVGDLAGEDCGEVGG